MNNRALVGVADTLIEVANKIANSIDSFLKLRDELKQRVLGKRKEARMEISTLALSFAGFGYREHTQRCLARLLAEEIMKDLDYEDVVPKVDHLRRGTLEIRARCYVFTQPEMDTLIEDAIRLGRSA